MRKTSTFAVSIVCALLGLGCSDSEDGDSNQEESGAATDKDASTGSGGSASATGGSPAATGGSAAATGGSAAATGGSAAPQMLNRAAFTNVGVTGSLDYSKGEMWACSPGITPNECDRELDATLIKADGTREVEKH